MKKASVLALREEILAGAKVEARQRMGAGLQSLANPRVESRMAVGYSEVGKGDFRLELRIQRTDGKAARDAEDVRDKAAGEVNIEVVPKVEIPSHRTILDEAADGGTLSRHRRPLEIGVSVGHVNGGAGTLGAFVGTPQGDCILSNNHVLALLGQAEPGDHIYQPGRPHQKPLEMGFRVARLENAAELARDDRNEFDAAVARIREGVDFIPNVIPSGLRCDKQGKKVTRVGGYDVLSPGKEVWKIGCGSGFTRGHVSAVGLSDLTILTSAGNVVFDEVVEIRPVGSKPFSVPGDSGSMVFTEDLVAFGLHFAGGWVERDDKKIPVSYCCSLQKVLDFFHAAMLK